MVDTRYVGNSNLHRKPRVIYVLEFNTIHLYFPGNPFPQVHILIREKTYALSWRENCYKIKTKRYKSLQSFTVHPYVIHMWNNVLIINQISIKNNPLYSHYILLILVPNVPIFCFYTYNNFPSNQAHNFRFVLVYILSVITVVFLSPIYFLFIWIINESCVFINT